MTATPAQSPAGSTAAPDTGTLAQALHHWMKQADYASWDPYDALASPLLAPFRQVPLLARICLQVVKRSPLNLRPFLAIPRQRLTKTDSDLLSALCVDPHPGADQPAHIRAWAAAVRARRLSGQPGSCWGMDLPYASRFTVATPETPNLFQTVNAVIALLDAHEALGDDVDLEAAAGVVAFLEQGLGRLVDDERHVVWRYYPGENAVVHNVNALIGSTLLRLARRTSDEGLAATARRTVQAVVDAQNDDGSWWYAADARGRWVDGFHSGYVLEALLEATRLEPDAGWQGALDRGMQHFHRRLLDADGMPRYLDTSRFPIDVQNGAQAVQVLAKWALYRHPHQLGQAHATLAAVCDALLVWDTAPDARTPRCHFALQRGRWFRNDLPAIRWGLAPMLLALRWLQRAELQRDAPQREEASP